MVAVPSVRVGSPLTHDKLTVFPLYLEAPLAPNYRLSEEALADGSAVVEEVTEGGSVPNLAVDNKGETLVLFSVKGSLVRGDVAKPGGTRRAVVSWYERFFFAEASPENKEHAAAGAVRPR